MQVGASIDRGTVVRKSGAGLYVVKSWERDGVLTLPLPAPAGIAVGDDVLFCEFADGQGAILRRIRDDEKSVGVFNINGKTPDANGRMTLAAKDIGAALDKRRFCEKVLLYYGYPIAINGAWSVDNACNIYRTYDICIFGDEYNDPAHETHADTVAIFKRMREVAPETRLVGYVPIGLDPAWPDSNLTMAQLKQRVDWWIAMGVNGIFLDEFGYDYNVTRARQNEIVSYCHDHGLFVFANSWSIEYVFSSEPMVLDWIPGFEPNPDGLAPLVGRDDYYLYENLFYTTEVQQDGSLALTCASVWRIDDVIGYYTRPRENGRSYYDIYGTKVCSLDAIPSDMDTTHKNILQSISVIGAAILNISAVAFGDEHWGATGYYHQWDLPDLDLATDGLNGVSVSVREYTDENGEKNSFPYSWTANINGHTYAIVFDIDNPDDVTWADGKRYASVNGVMVENAWMSIFDFQTAVREAQEKAETAAQTAEKIKEDVDEVMPTLSQAEENIRAVVDEAKAEISEAKAQLEAGLADLEAVTEGFGFKEVQW